MSAGLTATALEEAPLANFGSFFDAAVAGVWDENTGNTLAEIGLTLVNTGIDNNVTTTFFGQAQAYAIAVARRDSQEQARILQRIAQGFSRYYGQTHPPLSVRPLGTRRFAARLGDVSLFRETSPLGVPSAMSRTALVKLGPSGHLYFEGSVRARFTQHANEVVLMRLVGNVILGVDFLKDGPPQSSKPQIEFILIYQNGKLVDSVYNRVLKSRWAEFKQATVKTYLGDRGEMSHFNKVQFGEYKNYPVEAEIRDGVVVEVRILKPAANLYLASEPVANGVKELSLIFDKEGELVDSYYDQFKSEDFEALTEHTIVTRLDTRGVLRIGGSQKGTFKEHPDEVIAIRIRQGKIIQILFPDINKIKDVDILLVRETRDYSLIYDKEGKLVGSYHEKFNEEKFSQLKDNVVITNLNSAGQLSVGSKLRACFVYHPRRVVAVYVQNGVITKVTFLRAHRISEAEWPLKKSKDALQEIPFQLAWDAEGRLTDSFYSPRRIPSRFQKHLGKITGTFRVDVFNGFLHGSTHYFFGDNVDYRGWPLSEIVFGDFSSPGEITEFIIKNAKTGETIRLEARKYRQKLEWIDLHPPTPEDEILRAEQVTAVQRALGQFDDRAKDLLLQAAVLYYDSHHEKRSTAFWFLRALEDGGANIHEIATELDVTPAWLIQSFEKLRERLRD